MSPTSLNLLIESVILLNTSRKTMSRPSFLFTFHCFWIDKACFSRIITSMSFRASSLPISEDLISCWSSLLRSSVALYQRFSSCLYCYVSGGHLKSDLIDSQIFCARDRAGNKTIESIVICCITADGFHRVESRQRLTNKATDTPCLLKQCLTTAKSPNTNWASNRL